jgi:hypothetical protein
MAEFAQPDRPGRVEHLFVVRVWYEAGLADPTAWRGSIENTASGARRYFTDFQGLTSFIATETRPPQAPHVLDSKSP